MQDVSINRLERQFISVGWHTFVSGIKYHNLLEYITHKDSKSVELLLDMDIAKIALQFNSVYSWGIYDFMGSDKMIEVDTIKSYSDKFLYLNGLTAIVRIGGYGNYDTFFYKYLLNVNSIRNLDHCFFGHPYLRVGFNYVYKQEDHIPYIMHNDKQTFLYVCPTPLCVYKPNVEDSIGDDVIYYAGDKYIKNEAQSITKTYNNWVHVLVPDSQRFYKFVNMPIRVVETYEASADYFTIRNGYNNNIPNLDAYNSSMGTKKVFNHNVKKRIIVQPICHNVSRYYLTEEYKDVIAALHLSPFVFVTLDGEFCRVVPTDTKFSYKDMYKTDPLDLSVEFELLK